MFKKVLTSAALATTLTLSGIAAAPAMAADYAIDVQGAHASINFKVNHLGYSWLVGRFDKFDGSFSYDAENPEASKIEVMIDTTSVNSNHAARDKHIRSSDFLDVEKFPSAKFVSTAVKMSGEGKGVVTGDLTLHGVTKSIDIDVEKMGEGKDPWGGYRAGFTGSTSFPMKDFGITRDLGPASQDVFLTLEIEGIRK